MALSKIDTPAIADAAVTDAKSAVDLSALATNAALSSTQSALTSTQNDLATANATIASLRSDIGSLALQSARADNQAAFNLGNSFVDQFEDAAGIDTTTNSQRDPAEFVASVVETVSEIHPRADLSWGGQLNSANEIWSSGPTINGSQRKFESTAVGSGYHYSTSTIDLAGVRELVFEYEVVVKGGGGGPYFGLSFNKNGGLSSPAYTGTTTSALIEGASFDAGSNVGDRIKIKYNVLTGVSSAFKDVGGTGTYGAEQTAFVNSYKGSAWDSTTPTSMGLFHNAWTDGGSNWHIGVYNGYKVALTASPTGNFTGVTQTATASVSEMSIVVLYEDNAGTASLNTDITAEVSANNGADWSTVTLASAGNFSSNLKLAKSAPVSVTAGTQPKYRINFANQASGSKVTRIQGVALVY